MSEFDYKSVCILGRQPGLGLAELESLYGAENIRPNGSGALLNLDAAEINFKRLGGTIKVARILSVIPATNWKGLLNYLLENVPKHLEYVEPGKFTLGVSVYDLRVDINELNRGILQLKKAIKATGRPVRIIPNKALELNSAQVLHNKLTHRGAWELIFIKHGEETILAQTLFVQDIEAYAARDQARPKRDARVGMLPPKLAQTLINLANPEPGSTVLDPFCGTGVVLQEAALMGYNIYGTDLEPRMIDYTAENLDWLKSSNPQLENIKLHLEVADATRHKWTHPFDAVVGETFLGRPLNSLPDNTKLREIIKDADTIIRKFLINLLPQLPKGTKLALAVPAWNKGGNNFYHLPLIDRLTEMGYNRYDFKHTEQRELIYYRPDQTVARQLLVLEKK
jgi:tRNA G10  N-methylase Trm11